MVVNVHRVGDVALCRVRGAPTPVDVAAALKQARSIGARYDLWDLGEAVIDDWDETAIDGLIGAIQEHVAERAALVVPDEAAESLGTRIAARLDDEGLPVNVSIFTDASAAMAWLWDLHRQTM
jgi:hypothetical protein